MAISKSSVIRSRMIKGSYSMQKINEFIINDITPNDTILMDGATIHKSKALAEILKNNNNKRYQTYHIHPSITQLSFF